MAEKNAQNHLYRWNPARGAQDFPRWGPVSYGDAHHIDERAIAMAAIELRSVTKKFATADGGTGTARSVEDISQQCRDGTEVSRSA
jgi:hypothetical protein